MTAQEAKNQLIWVLGENNVFLQTTYFEHVMESLDRVNGPKGMHPEIFCRENEEDGTFEVVATEPRRFRVLETFPTEEEAETEVFQRVEKYDFVEDDQRDTWYAETLEKGIQQHAKVVADELEIQYEAAKSFLQHAQTAHRLREQKKARR